VQLCQELPDTQRPALGDTAEGVASDARSSQETLVLLEPSDVTDVSAAQLLGARLQYGNDETKAAAVAELETELRSRGSQYVHAIDVFVSANEDTHTPPGTDKVAASRDWHQEYSEGRVDFDHEAVPHVGRYRELAEYLSLAKTHAPQAASALMCKLIGKVDENFDPERFVQSVSGDPIREDDSAKVRATKEAYLSERARGLRAAASRIAEALAVDAAEYCSVEDTPQLERLLDSAFMTAYGRNGAKLYLSSDLARRQLAEDISPEEDPAAVRSAVGDWLVAVNKDDLRLTIWSQRTLRKALTVMPELTDMLIADQPAEAPLLYEASIEALLQIAPEDRTEAQTAQLYKMEQALRVEVEREAANEDFETEAMDYLINKPPSVNTPNFYERGDDYYMFTRVYGKLCLGWTGPMTADQADFVVDGLSHIFSGSHTEGAQAAMAVVQCAPLDKLYEILTTIPGESLHYGHYTEAISRLAAAGDVHGATRLTNYYDAYSRHLGGGDSTGTWVKHQVTIFDATGDEGSLACIRKGLNGTTGLEARLATDILVASRKHGVRDLAESTAQHVRDEVAMGGPQREEQAPRYARTYIAANMLTDAEALLAERLARPPEASNPGCRAAVRDAMADLVTAHIDRGSFQEARRLVRQHFRRPIFRQPRRPAPQQYRQAFHTVYTRQGFQLLKRIAEAGG
jgi:hypothetical protein